MAQVFDSSLSVPDTLEFPLLIKPVSEMYIHVTRLIKSSEAQFSPLEKLPLIVSILFLPQLQGHFLALLIPQSILYRMQKELMSLG